MKKGILIDDNGDVLFENGGLKIGDVDQQDVVLVVNTCQGDWKQAPLVGVGIEYYLGSNGKVLEIKQKIQGQLPAVGFRNVKVSVSQNGENIGYSVNAERP